MTQDQDSLSRLTLRQLRLKASDLGVPLYSRKSKAALIKEIAALYRKQYITKTQVLAASLRDVHSVSRCYEDGADIVTMPPAVFEKMYKHILTDKGLEQFDIDYAESVKE